MVAMLRAMVIFSMASACAAAMTKQAAERQLEKSMVSVAGILQKKMTGDDSSVTAGLVSIIVDMVKLTGSLSDAHMALLTSLGQKVETEEIPALLEDFQEDQDLLDLHAGTMTDCDTALASASSSVQALGSTSDQLKAAYEACEAERQSILDEKYNSSLKFSMWMNAQMFPEETAAPCKTYTPEVEEWLLERMMAYSAYNATYTEYKINETKVDVEAKLSIANCTGEADSYKYSYCSWVAQINSTATAYGHCRNESSFLFNSTLTRVKISEADRVDELLSLYAVQCQLQAISQPGHGLTDGSLDACSQLSGGDVSAIVLSVPTLAAYDTSLVSALGTPSADITC